MEKPFDPAIMRHFEDLEDPRVGNALRHPLLSVVVIAICAVISGADNWVDVQVYGKSKEKWLSQFIDLHHGIPSHDTFGRLFSLLDADQFEQCFRSWVSAVASVFGKKLIAIDGKTARRSHDRCVGKRALHMVSAWVARHHIALGQVKTEDHSNEIIAIPQLLEGLDISGSVITIDAMGCQKKIARQILAQGGDYVLALKENQSQLYERACDLFAPARRLGHLKHTPYSQKTTTGKDHGRQERRDCWVIPVSEWRFYLDLNEKWAGLKSVAMVVSDRTVNGKTSQEARYFISSLEPDAEPLLAAIRSHWGIENGLHWVLDIAFREDESRVRKGNGQHNLAIMRRLALNLLRRANSVKAGIAARRKRAGWDNDYLLEALNS